MGNDFFLGNPVNPGDDLRDLSADAFPQTNGLIDVGSLCVEAEVEPVQEVQLAVVPSNSLSKYAASAGITAIAALVFGAVAFAH